MAFKVSPQHWELFVNYMEAHPDLARGRINGPCGRETFKKLWSELALQLNSLGFGERTIQKWQKTWTDFKYALKKKASEIKSDLNGTGGGPPNGGVLTDLEIRITNILGKTFYEGLGVEETGLSFLNPPKLDKENKIESPSIIHKSVLVEVQAGTSTMNKNVLTPSTTPRKRQLNDSDHDYCTQPSAVRVKRMKENQTEDLYKETLNELKEINSSLKDIKGSIGGIESGINRLADAIINLRR